MMKSVVTTVGLLSLAGLAHAGGWVDFADETATRLPAGLNDPETSTNDPEEKDYIWGDVDQDGDVDLIVVRKVPFTQPGGKTNVLFMNEGKLEGHAVDGVLVDKTAMWATEADDGGQGFFDETNDRDVVLVDVNGDMWLDIVTATTVSHGLPKTISHPRVYINKGEADGLWQGFRYEEARIPQLYTMAGDPVAPRFCSVTAGDVTGDGAPDLYFGDYDSSGAGGNQQPDGVDLNDRLLVNDGTGVFTDSLESRMSSTMLRSAFGAAVVIADMNGDGVDDVVKDTGLAPPQQVSISYNDPNNEGQFDRFDVVYQRSPYFISVGDLNGDGLLDMVVVDDGTDRYLINQGNDANDQADFVELAFSAEDSQGFGGNSMIADLNRDGHPDVLIADVDVDQPGCGNQLQIYRNLGNLPNVSLQKQGQVIPDALLGGTHDVAVFDVNGDDWVDLVVGRCGSTEIWMNQPPVGIAFRYPDGLPAFVPPGGAFDFVVEFEGIGGAVPEPDSGSIFVALEAEPGFTEVSMTYMGNDRYTATLPAVPCPEKIRFYVRGLLDDLSPQTDPAGAPGNFYEAVATSGTEILFRDEIEGDVSEWTVVNDPTLESGAWEQADPNGTISGGGLASPEDDATGGEGTMAFVTENGPIEGSAGANDVDGGPTWLISPVIDLTNADATITYARWMFSSEEGVGGAEDFLVTEVSNDGTDWTLVSSITGTNRTWELASFLVGDYVEPSATVQVRFSTFDSLDQPFSSITEAGIDNFQVEIINCDVVCVGDIDGDGAVAFSDILAILAVWGPCPGCPEDLDGNGEVQFADLLIVLGAWGPCE